jgi:hypothetical protein
MEMIDSYGGPDAILQGGFGWRRLDGVSDRRYGPSARLNRTTRGAEAMFRQDLIQRAIEQLAAALARALKLSQSAQPAEALDALREAKGALPIVPGMLEDMPAATLIENLGRESAAALARVLAMEADLLDQLGRSLLGARPRLQSKRLLAELGRGAPLPAGPAEP